MEVGGGGGGGFWTKEKDAVMKLPDCHTNTEFLRKVVTKKTLRKDKNELLHHLTVK
jgi:hypothetical protein